jgi:TonB-linked SusC/RagA family outer membrane protein
MKRLYGLLSVLFIFSVQLVFAQTIEVHGKITEAGGAAIPDASVNIKGTKNGTRAGTDGSFRINAKSGVTLIISAVGFAPKEVIASADNINISLAQDVQGLSEVVVTALGIKREKRSLGYATQTVGNDALNKSGSGNPLSELNGKVSGLTVINSSGDPGGSTYIRLRGATSLTGNNQPLMVVDGVPIDNTVNNYDPTFNGFQSSGANADLLGGAQPTNRGVDINPDDIESVTVLKGPAATALYGIQASSGALIITTKKGKMGKRGTSVSFNSSVTIDKVSHLPGLQNKYSQGSGGTYAPPESGSSLSWGALIDTLAWDGSTSYAYDRNGNIAGKSSLSAKVPVTPYDRYAFFQKGVTYNNNISLTGNTEKSSYRLGLGNVYQTGIIPLSKYVKTTFSLNGQSAISDKFSISGGVTYINSANNKTQQGSNLSGVMLGLTRTPATFDNSNGVLKASDPASYILPDGSQRNYRGGGGYDNPYWSVNKEPFTSNLNRVFGYGQANYQLADWIGFTYRLGGDVYFQGDKNAYDINSRAFASGAVYLTDYTNSQYNSDFTINLKKQLTSKLSGSLIIGHNYFVLNQSNRFSSGTTLALPNFLDISNASSYLSSESEVRKRTQAFYASLDVAYNSMLYLTISGRREETSTLPASNNIFYYPSASLGWVFTELASLKNNSILSFGKVRASISKTGKDAAPYSLTTPYTTAGFNDGFTGGVNFPINSVPGYQISSAITTIGGGQVLKPEHTYSYEGGADLGFLKNRINLSFTAYYSKTTDDIYPISLPYSTGFAGKVVNAGSIQNKGLEVTLNTTPVKIKDLQWDVNFNWSRNVSKVLALYNGQDRFLIAGFGGGEAEIDAAVGQPYGVIYGNTTPHSDLNNIKSPLLIDDIKSDPNYGQPLAAGIGPNMVIGNTNPKWIGAVISTLTYKDFTFGAQVDIKHGGDMWNGTRGALANKGTALETANRGSNVVFNGLLGHLDNNGNVVHYASDGVTEVAGPGAANDPKNVTAYSQYYWQNIGSSFGGGQDFDIENAGFTRIRQVSLTYQLPKVLIQKMHFVNFSLTIFANNLHVWTKYDGVDPETSLTGPANAQGLDYFNNPGTKSYGVRLNLGF